MHIRLADTHDLPALLDLYHEVSDAMIGTPYDCSWRRDMHPTDELIAHFVTEGLMLVACEGGMLAAAVGVDHDLGRDYGASWLVDVPDDKVAVIHILTVRQAFRGQGLSRKLLRACTSECHARGMVTARLDVTVNNAPAIALYESEGYVTVGRGTQEVGPEDNPVIELLVMERTLP